MSLVTDVFLFVEKPLAIKNHFSFATTIECSLHGSYDVKCFGVVIEARLHTSRAAIKYEGSSGLERTMLWQWEVPLMKMAFWNSSRSFNTLIECHGSMLPVVAEAGVTIGRDASDD